MRRCNLVETRGKSTWLSREEKKARIRTGIYVRKAHSMEISYRETSKCPGTEEAASHSYCSPNSGIQNMASLGQNAGTIM